MELRSFNLMSLLDSSAKVVGSTTRENGASLAF